MKKLLLLFLLLSVGSVAHSQSIDNSFGPKFLKYGTVNAAVGVADDKIVIGGLFDYTNGASAENIARLNADGTIDGSFTGSYGGEIHAILKTADGKLIVAGELGVVRLNPNGSVDATFTSGITGAISIRDAGLQSTGKIVLSVAERKVTYTENTVRRLNTDGTIDASFHAADPEATVNSRAVNDLIVLANDKILISGNFNNYDNVTGANQLVGLNADGTVDNTFNAGLPEELLLYRKIALAPGGKIYTSSTTGLVRLNENGTADGTFTPVDPIVGYTNIVVLPDGTIFTTTTMDSNGPSSITKYNSSGTLSTSAGVGSGFSAFLKGEIFDIGNGKLFVNDRVQEPYSSHSIRNTSDLELAPGSNPISNVREDLDFFSSGRTLHFLQQPDGKLLVSGNTEFYTSGDVTELYKKPRVFRLNTDFTVDETFDYSASADIIWTQLQYTSDDGKIYATRVDPSYNVTLKRLNADGSVDGTFNVPYNFDDITKLDANTFAGIVWNSTEQRGHIIKFNTSGVVDDTFDAVSVGQMRTVDASSDGKMYVYIEPFIVSEGRKFNGTEVKSIFKINADGTLANPFDIGSYDIGYVSNANVVDDKLMTSGSAFDNGSKIPVQRWTSVGLGDLTTQQSFDGYFGNDFLVDGNHIYMLINKVGEFSIVRTDLNGVLDQSFKKLTYHISSYTNVPINPDRIHRLNDGSFLIKGFKMYHITLPGNVPTDPTNLTAESTTSTSVTLNWVHPSSDATVFEIERAEGPGTFAVIATIDGSLITYEDNTVIESKTYSYRVRALNAKGASAYTSTVITKVITGLEDPFTGLKVYPNPVKDQIQVQSGEIVYRYTVLQLDGRTVESASPNSSQFTINVNNYASGLYLLKLEQSGGKKIFKIFKQ